MGLGPTNAPIRPRPVAPHPVAPHPVAIRPDNRPGLRGPAPDNRPGRRVPAPPPPRPTVNPAGHYAPPAAPAAAPAVDPTLAGLLASYPQPESDAVMQARAQGLIDPLIAALTGSINARTQAGAGAIQGYTSQLQQDLGKYAGSAADIYGGAQASQAASDAALSQRLQGGGTEMAAGLADRLKGIGNGSDPSVQAAVQAAGQTGAGAGNALYGKGSASLADLISRGAAAQEYASKLPGIAGLSGAQQLGGLEQQAQNDLASGTQSILGQLPDIVGQMRSANDQKAANLAGAKTSLFEYQQGRQDTQAANQQSRADTQAANRANAASAAATNREHVREFNIGQNNAQRTAAAKALAAAQAQDTKLTIARMATETSVAKQQQEWAALQARIAAQNKRFNVQQQNETNRFNAGQTNANNRTAAQIAAENARAKAAADAKVAAAKAAAQAKAAAAKARAAANAKKAATPKALTAYEVQRFKATAATVADNAQSGFTDSKGVAHPAISAYAALREMRQEGIPDAIAVQAINRAYGTHFNPKGKLP